MKHYAVCGMGVVLAAGLGLLVVGCETNAPRSMASPSAAGDAHPARSYYQWSRGGLLGAEYSNAPDFDLHQTLRSARGGGGQSPFDETWIIARDGTRQLNPVADPGCGMMLTIPTGDTVPVPMPLKHTDVQATITGPMSCVRVEQQFHNPYDGKIEATYVFPLPEDAAVNEFLMVIGDRQIRGIIREKEEAERIYAEARSQGYVASLLTEERPNIFEQKVANIDGRPCR